METDVVAPSPKKPDLAERERTKIPPLMVAALFVGVVAVAYLGHEYRVTFSTTLFWGLALYVSNALIGFLFGIPKVPDWELQKLATPTTANATEGGSDPQVSRPELERVEKKVSRRTSGINSNLVEVSDWLTKIIVGVGLVELKNLPTYGESLAKFMAQSLVGIPADTGSPTIAALTSVAGAVALYFGVLGFIMGYLMTRIFLAVIMNAADRSAEEASGWRLPQGEVVDTTTLLGGLMKRVDDILGNTVQQRSGNDSFPEGLTPSSSAAPAVLTGGVGATADPAARTSDKRPPDPDASGAAPMPREGAVDTATDAVTQTVPSFGQTPNLVPVRGNLPPNRARVNLVLWVDDRPARNALIVDRLRAAGAQVDQAGTTGEAVDRLTRQPYDLIITDMHRGEKAGDGLPSGLRFLAAVCDHLRRSAAPPAKPMVVLYCSKRSLDTFGPQAVQAGVDLATSSEVELLTALARRFWNVR